MNHSNQLSPMPSNNPSLSRNIPLRLLYGAVIFALVGFIDASYLTIKHYTGGPIPCSILNGCETVISSIYAKILGIPVSLFGAAYYLTLLVLLLLYLDIRKFLLVRVFGYLTLGGLLFSIWLVSAQVFLIKSLCLYCLVSAATSTVLFVLGRFMLKYRE